MFWGVFGSILPDGITSTTRKSISISERFPSSGTGFVAQDQISKSNLIPSSPANLISNPLDGFDIFNYFTHACLSLLAYPLSLSPFSTPINHPPLLLAHPSLDINSLPGFHFETTENSAILGRSSYSWHPTLLLFARALRSNPMWGQRAWF